MPINRASRAEMERGPGMRRNRRSSGCNTAVKNSASTKENATSSMRPKMFARM